MKIKKIIFYIFTRSQSGQSMVEALVALGAAVIIISSITVAVVTSVSNTSYSANQNKATQLAREGIEAARQLRDTDYSTFSQKDGKYCYGENQTEFVEGTFSTCKGQLNIVNKYNRTLQFFKAGVDNNCGTAGDAVTEVVSIVSWPDSKCPAGEQLCRKVKLVSCLSNPNTSP